MTDLTLGTRLLALKERSRLSLKNIAKAAGYRSASSIQRYFSPEYDAEYLPSQLASRLREALIGFGDPKIEHEDIERLTEYGFLLDRESRPGRALGPAAFQVRETRFIECNASNATGEEVGTAEVFVVADDPRLFLSKPAHLHHRVIEAFYVTVTSSMPRYNPGEIVFYERYRPAAIGEDVYLTLCRQGDEGPYEVGIIGRLVTKSRNSVSVEVHGSGIVTVVQSSDVGDVMPILRNIDFLPAVSRSETYATT